MSNQLLLSVIVPVYNVEKYLSRCLDSILSQSIKDQMEIIVVNDASTDNSLFILREYEESYPNIIKIIDLKTNQGAGVSRYMASKLSQGKYIGFVDSDDYLKSPHYFSQMIESLEKEQADIAITGYSISTNQLNGEIGLKEIKGISNIKNELTVFKTPREVQSVFYSSLSMLWIKVFKRDFYVDGSFDTRVPSSRAEDRAIFPLFLFANKIVYVPSFDYVYNQRNGSLCDFSNTEKYNYLEFKKECLDWSNYLLYENSLLEEHKKPEGLDFFIKDLVITQIFSRSDPDKIYKNSSKEDKRKIVKELFSFMRKNKIKVNNLFYSDLRSKEVKFYQHFLIFLASIFSVFHYIMPVYTFIFMSFIRAALNGRVSKDKIKKNIKNQFPVLLQFYYFYTTLRIKNSLFFRKFFLKKKREEIPVIITLATYPGGDRHKTVYLTIKSLLAQTLKPKKILLWLYEGEFPRREKDLPAKLLNLQDNRFEIRWSKKDIKSYNKIINTLEEFPNEVIITTDDDVIYQENWLESLWVSYEKKPESIHAHRVSKFYKDGNHWESKGGKINFYKEGSFLNKLTGIGGVLYPPNCFYKDILREDLYMSLAPTNDDLWLWSMVVLNNRVICRVEDAIPKLNAIPSTQRVSLFLINDFGEGLYWTHFRRLIDYYPIFKEKLEADWIKVGNSSSLKI